MKEHLELSSLGASLLAEAERISGEIQDWRRDFHQFPEFAFEENITASKITNVMRSIPGMSAATGFAIQTSVIGVLGAEIPGPALMLRATMDATAAEEQTGLPFSSCMPGAMHGCGHDAEMASLLGAASVLSKYRGELKQRVVFLFQPAGEGRSGAKTLTENNIIEKFHIGRSVAVNWASELPYGELFTRRGVMTALSDRIHIDIRGTAGHAAEPHMTVDPVTIAANVIIMIQTMLSREVDPREPVVVSFGQVESGEAYNIIPEQANLWGTLRAFDPKVRDFVQSRIEAVAPAIAKAFRGLASVEYTRNYAQVDNNLDMVDELLRVGVPFFGEDGLNMLERPLLSGDDFAFFSHRVPSLFMLMGTGLEYPLHHPRYDVPESMLSFSAAWEAYLALTFGR
ncbi:M20 metallopeptidase family protein [Cloacibacillus evryensis]|uniref:M20 metallopeptidase family protein n=1 Tax=Cloacibacillus evryensis TaxID=508460 RepID=UPI00241C7B78|nr:M20 family metallopeptidase [Cloacibacillus evryensis]